MQQRGLFIFFEAFEIIFQKFMENLLYFFHLISNSNIQDLTLLPQSFEALAQGIHPSVALA
jgi:hypothetical protein